MTRWIRFDREGISAVPPNAKGVYWLSQEGEIVYIGQGNIRERLIAHRSGRGDPGTQSATDFRFEITRTPAKGERELLKAYKESYGDLPPLNDRMPKG